MKTPTSWLKKYISIDKSPEEISDILTMAGLEVEYIDHCQFDFKGVITAKIAEISPHPEERNLSILEITDGKKEYQIVSACQTLREGQIVAFAKVGATVFDASRNGIHIEKTKLKGVESNGMLCSKRDLGLSNEHETVLTLPSKTKLGEDLEEVLRDPTYEIVLTPNLGYCRHIFGIARELSILTDVPLKPLAFSLKEDPDIQCNNKVAVINDAPNECFQYKCRIIKGIEVKESPEWMKDLLEKAGIKPINNVVDITNFVMIERGQPLHAFDFDKLPHKKITIRNATEGDTITTLDGVSRSLPENTLLICDKNQPIAIAGIMGGEETKIDDKTHTILLESAHFSPTAIRKNSRDLGLRTESSSRFENQVDPLEVELALEYAAYLLQLHAGGIVLRGVVDASERSFPPKFVSCRLSKVCQTLGIELDLEEMDNLLKRLRLTFSGDSSGLFQIKVHSWRNDITSEIDIIEEIAKTYGLHNIKKADPRHISSMVPDHPVYLTEQEVRKRLIASGLQECITCDLISPVTAQMGLESGLYSDEYISVLSAKSIDQSVLRPSLLPPLLGVALHNQNLGNTDLSTFELGRVHFKENGEFSESPSLGIMLSGVKTPAHWSKKNQEFDYYDLKGIIESLFNTLNMPKIDVFASSFKVFHPKRQSALSFNDKVCGVFGEIHPIALQKLGLRSKVLCAEIDLNTLIALRRSAHFKPISMFPSSERDWTVTMKRNDSLGPVLEAIDNIQSPLLKKASLLDIYTGDKVSSDEKNATFRFTYRNDDHTLEISEVEKEHQQVISHLKKFT